MPILKSHLLSQFGPFNDYGMHFGGYMAGDCVSGREGQGLLAIEGKVWFEAAHTSGSTSRGAAPPPPTGPSEDHRHGPAHRAMNLLLASKGTPGRVAEVPGTGFCGAWSMWRILKTLPASYVPIDPQQSYSALRKQIDAVELELLLSELGEHKPSTKNMLDVFEVASFIARYCGGCVLCGLTSHFSAKSEHQRVDLAFALYELHGDGEVVRVDLQEEQGATPLELLTGSNPVLMHYTSLVHQSSKRSKANAEPEAPIYGLGDHIEPVVVPHKLGSGLADPYTGDIYTSSACWPLDEWMLCSERGKTVETESVAAVGTESVAAVETESVAAEMRR